MPQYLVTLRDQAGRPQLFVPATHTREHTTPFHALTGCSPHGSHHLPFMKLPQGDLRSPVLSSLPGDSRPATCFLLTPLESVLTKLSDLKSFRIGTYEKRWGEGCKLLTRSRKTTFPNPSRQPRSMPTVPLQYWAHGATIGPWAETVPPLLVSKPLERTSGIEAFGNAQSVLSSFATAGTVDPVALDGSGRSGCRRRTGKAGIV
jgi:hypothetical protein